MYEKYIYFIELLWFTNKISGSTFKTSIEIDHECLHGSFFGIDNKMAIKVWGKMTTWVITAQPEYLWKKTKTVFAINDCMFV